MRKRFEKWRFLGSAVVPLPLVLILFAYASHFEEFYGATLFLGLPTLIGFLSALVYARTGPATWGQCYVVSVFSNLLFLLCIIGFRLDGLICVVMAAPWFLTLSLVGGIVAYSMRSKPDPRTTAAFSVLAILAFPCALKLEQALSGEPRLHEVTTRIEVDAPIQSVWDEVVAFDRIDTPPTGVFRWGIAYPIEARIEGEGVGAVRHCVFSTGPFVEPITRWDPPHALEFDVSENPIPMHELSPWGEIDVPHLHGTFASERGRFRLSEAGGKTILEGTTWYRQAMAPGFYWSAISNEIVHRIHLRVLEHIKSCAEAER